MAFLLSDSQGAAAVEEATAVQLRVDGRRLKTQPRGRCCCYCHHFPRRDDWLRRQRKKQQQRVQRVQ
jgi:hypothetical protein